MGKSGSRSGLVRTILRCAVVIIVALCVVAVVVMFKDMNEHRGEPEISTTFVAEKLSDCSDLTSAELAYRGVVSFQDGDIPFLTQKAFQMIYTAQIEAGFDLSQVGVEVDDVQLRIMLPAVEVRTPTILPDSIEIVDEQRALLNWANRDDTVEAMQIAGQDALAHADIEGLKARAAGQAQTLVTNLFEGFIGDRQLIVEFASPTGSDAAQGTDAAA